MRVSVFFSILVLSFFTGEITAQFNSEFLNYENTGRSVSLNGEYDAGASSIQNAMINKFIFGGYIDNAMKDKALNKMKGYNRFGVNMNYDISVFFGRKPKFSYLIGVKNQEIINSTYTKDFYTLAFYGNKPFLDKTANFSGTNINALRFQELKFGVILHKIDTSAKMGISISLLKGEQFFHIKANANSSLYTNADGSELTFQSNFNMAVSDTNARQNPFSFNGVGGSADIFFETPYKSKVGTLSVLTVNANNIGFVHWRNNSVQYSSDSTLRFDGYHITNILDLKDSTLQKINTDSVLRRVTNARSEEFNTNIPTNLIIINKIYFGKGTFALNTGFRHIFHSNYKPYLFFEGEFKIKRKVTLTVHAGYGGYTQFNAGLTFTYNSKHWFFKLGSNSLQGFVAPGQTFGQGVFLSIAKKFK